MKFEEIQDIKKINVDGTTLSYEFYNITKVWYV